jgi:hypothetical protein
MVSHIREGVFRGKLGMYGIFGMRPGLDVSLSSSPVRHSDPGDPTLIDFHFRGHRFDVHMHPEDYVVFKDGRQVSRKPCRRTGQRTGHLASRAVGSRCRNHSRERNA